MKKYTKTIILLVVIALLAGGAYFSKFFFKDTRTTMSNRSPEQAQKHVEELLQKATAKPAENPVVGMSTGKDFDAVTRKAVENAGGLKNIIKKGDTVLLKTNMIMAGRPEQAIVTDYRVVQTIADMAKEAGASKVLVGDGSPWGRVLQNKMTKYDQIKGVEIVDFNDFTREECYKLQPLNPVVKGQDYYIPKVYMDADVVISMAKLKTHYEAVITLSLKNAFGIPPVNSIGVGKNYLHTNGIPNSIVDLNLIRKPEFVVIDGIIGGEGNGPLRPTPVDSQVMIAGTDPVACDTVGLTFMGFTVNDIPHVKLAGEKGLGINDLSKIKIVGADLDKIKMKFKRATSY
ncbi:MAG: DUF362 domain-containing protein [Clostridia bacterium]|nr:DUF362 domain-containing protein [Clostridia bacterium]